MAIRSSLLTLALGAALAAALPGPAVAAPEYAGGHVVVRYQPGTDKAERARVQWMTGTSYSTDLPGGARTLRIHDGESVKRTVTELRRHRGVAYAVPDYEVQAADFIPNDPGRDDIA